MYLEEQKIDRKVKLDILHFWKGNQYRYPEVAAMARDILCILISTVTSKSAFSNSGRILNRYRSALKPDIVEALVCSKDLLYRDNGNCSIFFTSHLNCFSHSSFSIVVICFFFVVLNDPKLEGVTEDIMNLGFSENGSEDAKGSANRVAKWVLGS